jgi:dTDP-4-dehydrorhamnose 3,5-epimerase
MADEPINSRCVTVRPVSTIQDGMKGLWLLQRFSRRVLRSDVAFVSSSRKAPPSSARVTAFDRGSMSTVLEITPLDISDVMIIRPKRFDDARGFFSEVYSRAACAEHGIHIDFVQDNHSLSRITGTLRGLHFQAPPFAQDKLVRVTRGRILDVAVDIRKGSSTYGRHVAVELSANNWRQLLVPVGFAHGFCTLEPDTEVVYKVSAIYDPKHEGGIFCFDRDLAIPWPVDSENAIISDRDKQLPHFGDLSSPF